MERWGKTDTLLSSPLSDAMAEVSVVKDRDQPAEGSQRRGGVALVHRGLSRLLVFHRLGGVPPRVRIAIEKYPFLALGRGGNS
jgi:hypothetical protein